ncbi:MAG TPA: PstS family phosphate ABC transporter substrate-binding protein [Dehalococcoidia bacterium]|nr:PstS family phosphate ABC transporter substrate-binding protein [Dehalococcoidia bacterium]
MLLTAALLAACGQSNDDGSTDSAAEPRLSGNILIDGSSTVFPITEAVAEEFRRVQRNVNVTVGISGTGGGFQKFCNGETSISDASRPIRQPEIETCKAKGIEWIEIPVAYDALSVVVNPQNTWASCMTTTELKKLWSPEAQGVVTKWSDIRADWPNETIRLFGPGTDSGTFDYFTEAINGKEDASRGDYTASEDDNVLVQGVSGDRYALGYFGLAYYIENQNKLKAVQIDQGKGCVTPSAATVESGAYTPLSRPLFIYVRRDHADRPEVKAFVDFYLKNVPVLAKEVGYVPFPPAIYELATARWTSRKTGTAYVGDTAGKTVLQIYQAAAAGGY